mmetsp:Transcript_52211/g.151719  ORF Transcript_52211/g.151719 Transcript_52211/m.151719 type:complete len:269 (+) Transcript_52211:246-1052(+)
MPLKVTSSRSGGAAPSRLQAPDPHLDSRAPASCSRNQPFCLAPSCAQAHSRPRATHSCPSSRSSGSARPSSQAAAGGGSGCRSSVGTQRSSGPQSLRAPPGASGSSSAPSSQSDTRQKSAALLPRRTSEHRAFSSSLQFLQRCLMTMGLRAASSSSRAGGAASGAGAAVRLRSLASPGKPASPGLVSGAPSPEDTEPESDSSRPSATCRSADRSLAATKVLPSMSSNSMRKQWRNTRGTSAESCSTYEGLYFTSPTRGCPRKAMCTRI